MFSTKVQADTIYWQDDFQRTNGDVGNSWIGASSGTAQIVEGNLHRTDSGGYRGFYNLTDETLPANYYVSFVVPDDTVASNWWGLAGRYLPGSGIGTGVKIFWQSNGRSSFIVGNANIDDSVSITVTNGFPDSWTVDQDHMVTLRFSGTTVTIYLDGTEYGYFTSSTNNQTGTGIASLGDGGSGNNNVSKVMVTDYLPTFGTVIPPEISDLNATLSSTTSATVSWTTNIPATSKVDYGLTTAYGSSVTSSDFTDTHSVTIANVTPNSLYHYRVSSTSESGGETVSSDGLFTTTVTGSDLGLHATSIEWLDTTHIRATYDWSADDQLLDWITTANTTAVRGNNIVTVNGSSGTIYAIKWKQPISISKLTANAAASGGQGHLNIYTNLDSSWAGNPFNPSPGLGVVWRNSDAAWDVDGGFYSFSTAGSMGTGFYDFQFSVGATAISTLSSIDNTLHERSGSYTPVKSGLVAVGAFGGESKWGTVIVEGEVYATDDISPPPASNVLPTISSVTDVLNDPTSSVVISWTTDQSTTSVIEYGETTDYGTTLSSSTLTKSHSRTITSLTSNKTYHYRVSSVNASGLSAVSDDYSFTTLATDEVIFKTTGSSFSPLITTTGEATILWTFDDGTTSLNSHPTKDYGSAATRFNRLKVTPWSSITGVNIGYDGEDGGPSTITHLSQQNVTAIYGMANMASYLTVWSSSNNPLTSLDFENFVKLTDIECYYCQLMKSVNLKNTALLTRVNFENNDLDSLDLSESPKLADLRAALNNFTEINWGDTGSDFWHICTRDNPQLTSNYPDLDRFPLLRELFLWNDNQSGEIKPTSTNLVSVLVANNHYSSADFSGNFARGIGGNIDISNNDLTSLKIDNDPGLTNLNASDNLLNQTTVDYILETLDSFDTSNGVVNLTDNSDPSTAGMVHVNSLRSRGWTVNIDPDTTSPIISSVKVEPSANQAVIFWNTDELSSSKIDFGLTTNLGETTPETDISPRVSTHSKTINNLLPCTIYHYRAHSRDNGTNEGYDSLKSFTTTGCVGFAAAVASTDGEITRVSGGSVELKDDSDKGVTLTVPQYFSETDADFQIHQLSTNTTINETSLPTGYTNAGDYLFELKAFDESAQVISIFDQPLTVSISYSPANITGVDESSLKIWRWDGSNWYMLPNCTVNTTAKTVTCQTASFSVFGLFGTAATTESNTPVVTSESVSTSNNAAPICTDSPPGPKVPWLFGAIPQGNESVMLYFTEADDPVDSYNLVYGTEPGVYKYGALKISGKGLGKYLVNSLSPGTKYYFRIQGMHGCQPGAWSNEISVRSNSFFNPLFLPINELNLEPTVNNHADTCSEYTVNSGDTLWSIAQKELGDPHLFTELAEQNSSEYPSLLDLKNPIKVGWKLKMNCQPKHEEEKSQSYNLKITLVDEKNTALAGAKITLDKKETNMKTDQNGLVEFKDVLPGEHTISAFYQGRQVSQTINLSGDMSEFKLHLQVKPQSVAVLWLIPIGVGIILISILVFIGFRKILRR